MSVTIKHKDTGTTLASAEADAGVVKFEGNWYFDPATVNAEALKVTERTYTCPHKGTCNWVDFVGPGGETARDVGWVYPAPKPGAEAIRGRYGFYAGARGATTQS